MQGELLMLQAPHLIREGAHQQKLLGDAMRGRSRGQGLHSKRQEEGLLQHLHQLTPMPQETLSQTSIAIS